MTLLLFLISLFVIFNGVLIVLFNSQYYLFRKKTKLPFFHKKKYEGKELSKRKDILQRIQAFVFAALGITWISFSGIYLYQSSENTTTLNDDSFNGDLASVVDDFMQNEHVPGLVVGIIQGDKASLLCSGYSNLENDTKVNEETLFEIGSLTKVFTGALLSKAIEDEKVELSSNVADLLSSNRDYENLSTITLKHLVTHTSRLPRMIISPRIFVPAVVNTIFLRNPYMFYSDDAVLTYLSQYRVKDLSEPEHKYSNLGVGLLGYLISNVYGDTYENVVNRFIFQPLGMADSCFDISDEDLPFVAKGYAGFYPLNPFSEDSNSFLCFKSQPWFFDDIMAGAGAIRSNGKNMMLFLSACIDGNYDFLNRSMEVLYEEDGFSSGMCWGIINRPSLGGEVVFHDGGTGGFRSFLVLNKETQTGVVVLSNSTKKVSSLALELMALLHRDTKKPNSE